MNHLSLPAYSARGRPRSREGRRLARSFPPPSLPVPESSFISLGFLEIGSEEHREKRGRAVRERGWRVRPEVNRRGLNSAHNDGRLKKFQPVGAVVGARPGIFFLAGGGVARLIRLKSGSGIRARLWSLLLKETSGRKTGAEGRRGARTPPVSPS